MTSQEFKAIRINAGLTQVGLAKLTDSGVRTIQQWEAGDRSISGPVSVLMRLIEMHGAELIQFDTK